MKNEMICQSCGKGFQVLRYISSFHIFTGKEVKSMVCESCYEEIIENEDSYDEDPYFGPMERQR